MNETNETPSPAPAPLTAEERARIGPYSRYDPGWVQMMLARYEATVQRLEAERDQDEARFIRLEADITSLRGYLGSAREEIMRIGGTLRAGTETRRKLGNLAARIRAALSSPPSQPGETG